MRCEAGVVSDRKYEPVYIWQYSSTADLVIAGVGEVGIALGGSASLVTRSYLIHVHFSAGSKG